MHRTRIVSLLISALLVLAAPAATPCPYEFALEWGSYGSGPGQMQVIHDIALTPDGGIVAADYRNHRIRKFSPDGVELLTIGTTGTGPGQLRNPISLAVDGLGNYVVTELTNFRIQRFDASGNFLNQWAVPMAGSYSELWSLAADASGNVYVPFSSEGVVRKYAPDGTLLQTWSSGDPNFVVANVCFDENGILHGQDGPDYMKLSADLQPLTDVLPSPGAGNFDVRAGRHYYARGSLGTVDVYEESGAFLCSMGAAGTGPGKLEMARRALPLPDGRVIASDMGYSKLVRFDPAAVPALRTSWGRVKHLHR